MRLPSMIDAPAIESINVSAYTVPTDAPESDGTLQWNSTTLVLVEGRDALSVHGAWQAMVHAMRNLGRSGIASSAIAAVDAALWDLKARLLDVALSVALARPVDTRGAHSARPCTLRSFAQAARRIFSRPRAD